MATVAIAALVACDQPPVEGGTHPLDDLLRVDHLQVKGTHNSYHVAPDAGGVVDWDYTHAPLAVQAGCQGVRQFELDVTRRDDDTFAVYHVPLLDEGTTCATLRDCLGGLRAWSDAHPAHHPLFVMIEPKDPYDADSIGGWFQALEAAIADAWPVPRIVTPDRVRGDHPDLRIALTSDGWPTLGETRGQLLLWLLETGDYRAAYTHGDADLTGRLMFVKSDLDAPYGAILIRDDPVAEGDAIATAVADAYLVRTRADGGGGAAGATDLSRFEAALDSGATFISTDFAVPPAGTDYDITLPGGTPSRCNPVTAPAACVPTALEDPALVGADGC